MKRSEYLQELKRNLSRLPVVERDEILRDQAEYFDSAIAAGRSEEDICRALGDPRTLAASFVAQGAITRAENSSTFGNRVREIPRIFGSLLILAPLNFIVVLGPYLAAAAILLALWAASLAIGAASVWSLGQFHLSSSGAAALGMAQVLSVDFFAIGMGALAAFAIIGSIALTRYFILATIAYLRWNVNFVLKFRKEEA